jgi:hypothetical protein
MLPEEIERTIELQIPAVRPPATSAKLEIERRARALAEQFLAR